MSEVFSKAALARRLVIAPGWGGSGADHWQSLWEAAHPRSVRTAPASWDQPDVEDWIRAVDSAVRLEDERPVIVAHSLGTYATAMWLERHPDAAHAVLFVAPPDPGRESAPAEIAHFARDGFAAAAVPALVIASDDDPFGNAAHARWFAAQVGAELTMIGPRGHINAASGLGLWPEGAALFDSLLERA